MSVNSGDGEAFQLGIHWPYCIDRSCPGCMPILPEIDREEPELDLSIFRKDVQ